MSRLKVGIQLASLGLPFKRALETASRLRADAVELDARHEVRPAEMSATAIRQLRKTLDDLRLRVSAVRFGTRRGYDVVDDLDRRIDATKSAMTFAYALGTSVVINAIGRVPEDRDVPQWNTMIQALTDIGAHGQRCGAWLAADTGTEAGGDLLRMIEALPDGSLQVNFDPGNLIINGFSAEESMSLLAPHIVHVHAQDGVRDLAQGRGLQVALGRGSVDFPLLAATLEQVGYPGYYTIKREKSEQVIEEVAAAVQYLRAL